MWVVRGMGCGVPERRVVLGVWWRVAVGGVPGGRAYRAAGRVGVGGRGAAVYVVLAPAMALVTPTKTNTNLRVDSMVVVMGRRHFVKGDNGFVGGNYDTIPLRALPQGRKAQARVVRIHRLGKRGPSVCDRSVVQLSQLIVACLGLGERELPDIVLQFTASSAVVEGSGRISRAHRAAGECDRMLRHATSLAEQKLQCMAVGALRELDDW